jgi:hypothetical protein
MPKNKKFVKQVGKKGKGFDFKKLKKEKDDEDDD